jgi:hypothetical protein
MRRQLRERLVPRFGAIRRLRGRGTFGSSSATVEPLAVEDVDAAFQCDEFGSCSFESGDESLLLALMLVKLDLNDLDSISEHLWITHFSFSNSLWGFVA